jgi:hypothetical protein
MASSKDENLKDSSRATFKIKKTVIKSKPLFSSNDLGAHMEKIRFHTDGDPQRDSPSRRSLLPPMANDGNNNALSTLESITKRNISSRQSVIQRIDEPMVDGMKRITKLNNMSKIYAGNPATMVYREGQLKNEMSTSKSVNAVRKLRGTIGSDWKSYYGKSEPYKRPVETGIMKIQSFANRHGSICPVASYQTERDEEPEATFFTTVRDYPSFGDTIGQKLRDKSTFKARIRPGSVALTEGEEHDFPGSPESKHLDNFLEGKLKAKEYRALKTKTIVNKLPIKAKINNEEFRESIKTVPMSERQAALQIEPRIMENRTQERNDSFGVPTERPHIPQVYMNKTANMFRYPSAGRVRFEPSFKKTQEIIEDHLNIHIENTETGKILESPQTKTPDFPQGIPAMYLEALNMPRPETRKGGSRSGNRRDMHQQKIGVEYGFNS